jgi:hypothetical protein
MAAAIPEAVDSRDGFDETEQNPLDEVNHDLANTVQQLNFLQARSHARRDTRRGGRAWSEPLPSPEGIARMQLNSIPPPLIDDTGSTQHPLDGPTSADMIPAMEGLSHLEVSFGSATDVPMPAADSVLGKRMAGEAAAVQGQNLSLTLALNYGDRDAGRTKKGKRDELAAEGTSTGGTLTHGRGRKAPAGRGALNNLTRSNVWSRQAQ